MDPIIIWKNSGATVVLDFAAIKCTEQIAATNVDGN